jgi:uncharacterized protein YbaP (TraB family)
MRRLLTAILVTLAFVGGQAAPAPHPALWKVTGRHSTIYLFGSVHILSPTLQWRDARIGRAIDAADSFFFETALDKAPIQKYVAERGSLPAGQSLRALLPPESQKDLDDDFTTLGVPEKSFDTRRPWLATLAMITLKASPAGTPPTGVDVSVMADANSRGKPLRYFETMEEQLALIVPDDPEAELKDFETFLQTFSHQDADMASLMEAWSRGDDAALARLVMKDFDKNPQARKVLFDDRNARWVTALKSVLDSESGTVLVTVGAGHLLGEHGVPALLRAAGYKVERL